jgi:hypothetical protein
VNILTFRIKPNDELSLKFNLEEYSSRTTGIHKRTPKRKDCCKDPNYVLDDVHRMHFKGRTVVVTMTEIKERFDDNGNYLGAFYYIHVKDRAGITGCFPIEFIDKSRCLRRNHKRLSLHCKKLICER